MDSDVGSHSDQNSSSRKRFNVDTGEVSDASRVSPKPKRFEASKTEQIVTSKNEEIENEKPANTNLIDEWETSFCMSPKIELNETQERYPDKKIKVLILNHEKFDVLNDKLERHTLDFRHGAKTDIDDLKAIFESLNYNVSVFPKVDKDLTKDDAINRTKEVIESMDKYDQLIVIISTHGNVLQLAAYDGVYDIADYLKLFQHKNLEGKPKFIILNACRVDGIFVIKDENSSEQKTSVRLDRSHELEYFRELELEDCLLVYGSYPGKEAHRNTKLGTRLLRSLRVALRQLSERKEERLLIDLLNDIKRHVSTLPNLELTQMPMVTYNLCKRLYIGISTFYLH